MLSKAVACIASLALAAPSIAAPGAAQPMRTSTEAAAALSTALKRADRLDIYFVSLTGEYSLQGQKLKDSSSIRIVRPCGANCEHLMRDVIAHLKAATPTPCAKGQENVLIEIGNEASILYSHGGRNISFEGSCYFNPTGVGTIIRRSDFIFQ
ncbi:hypothetical protein [Stenotrophomonas sp. PS02289]|uniref:hypothetical protein n=1 Tax=Stenotrophomonas sp. PS02289 TaxID=2991422 RepID=UPI00249AEF59|nr:hypothetical protein [Stenotrophomonas sp. PS02289]